LTFWSAACAAISPEYNSDVTRSLHRYLLIAALLLPGCNRAAQSKEAVRAAVVDHLAKNTGLDVSSMTIDVGNVTFTRDEAIAAVSFRPKSSPDAGMTMNYTLERRGSKWVVAKRGDNSGHAAQPGSDLPPGHPPLDKPDATRR
jgi:hypothetical protein